MNDSLLYFSSGPFKVNGCPLRRISQRYLIATSTKLDISDVEVPAHLNDKYFKRTKKIRVKKEEGDLFASKKALVSERILKSLLDHV